MRAKALKLTRLMQTVDIVKPNKMKSQRLTTKELLVHLPRIPLHQQLFLEVKINGIWKPLFEGDFFGRSKNPIGCNVCQMEISPTLFIDHFTIVSHMNRLGSVEQIYHPIYTFEKDEWDLANGYKVPDKDKDISLGRVDTVLSKRFHAAKLFLGRIEKFFHLFADCKMPIKDFLELEYCNKQTEMWKPVIIHDGSKLVPKFACNICLKGYFSATTVYTHFRGRSHLKVQERCFKIRSQLHPQVNKHCMFIAGEKFHLNVNNRLAWDNLNLPEVVNKDEIQYLPIHGGGGGNRSVIEENEGLIGVEYVVQITSDEQNRMYECCLCEIVTDSPIGMQLHLIDFDHRLKYCEQQYGKALDIYKVAIGTINYRNYKRTMNYVLHRLASAIESRHSRAMPLKVDEVLFHNERLQVIIDLYNLPHASQWIEGPSFANIITNKEINDVKLCLIDYRTPKITTDWCGRFLMSPKEKYLNIERDHASSIERDMQHYGMPSPIPSNEQFHNMPTVPVSPKREFRNQSPIYHLNQPTSEVIAIEGLYREYRENPESHPEYETEWNDFWKQKRRELLSQGIDHHSYDFQPEWVLYFKNRLEDMYIKTLRTIQSNAASSMPVKRHLLDNPPTRIIKKSRLDNSIPNENRGNQVRRREPLLPSPRTQDDNFTFNDNKPNIIHVLRNLSAVEEHLGSLGTKILDLLSETLCLEKTVSNIEELYKLMLTEKKCSILELANEKLKGLLFAGLMTEHKIPIFKKIINSTSDLLKFANHIQNDNNTIFPLNGGNFRNGVNNL